MWYSEKQQFFQESSSSFFSSTSYLPEVFPCRLRLIVVSVISWRNYVKKLLTYTFSMSLYLCLIGLSILETVIGEKYVYIRICYQLYQLKSSLWVFFFLTVQGFPREAIYPNLRSQIICLLFLSNKKEQSVRISALPSELYLKRKCSKLEVSYNKIQ